MKMKLTTEQRFTRYYVTVNAQNLYNADLKFTHLNQVNCEICVHD